MTDLSLIGEDLSPKEDVEPSALPREPSPISEPQIYSLAEAKILWYTGLIRTTVMATHEKSSEV